MRVFVAQSKVISRKGELRRDDEPWWHCWLYRRGKSGRLLDASNCDACLPSQQTSYGAPLADKIRQSHSVIGAAGQMKTGHYAQQRLELSHAVQVAYGVLRHRVRPTAHDCFRSFRQGAKDAA